MAILSSVLFRATPIATVNKALCSGSPRTFAWYSHEARANCRRESGPTAANIRRSLVAARSRGLRKYASPWLPAAASVPDAGVPVVHRWTELVGSLRPLKMQARTMAIPEPVAKRVLAGESVGVPGKGAVDELTDRNVRRIVELERASQSTSSTSARVAARIAAFCGTTTFVWLHIAWFGSWLFVNTSSFFDPHPDPFPFPMLTLKINLEAIFLAAFILIGQNHQTRLTEKRSHLDLQINLLTEQENTQMLKMLQSIAAKVDADFEKDPNLAAMQQATHPEKLVDQIDKATKTMSHQPET